MSCGVGRRSGSDLALLWLWCRPVATDLIRLLAWEAPYAVGMALKRQKGKKKKKKKNLLTKEQSALYCPLLYPSSGNWNHIMGS